MLCVKVPKSEGEKVRLKLLHHSLLSLNYKIESEGDTLFIPVTRDPGNLIKYPLVQREVEELKTDTLPEELEKLIPSSYDIVGDIALVKVPDQWASCKEDLGKAILMRHKNVNTVLEDTGVHGEFRIREVKYMAGERKTSTVHREYGIEIEVDLGEVYFSPRLATERWTVTQKVKTGEKVMDMFSGVGPYTLLIAKNKKIDIIHAVDINPKAVEFLKRNVQRNGVEALVKIWQGDSRKICEKVKVDRVIMNLPHSAKDFLNHAFKVLNKKGAIHYYEILSPDDISKREKQLIEDIKKKGRNARIVEKREVRTYSAEEVQIAFDIIIE